MKCSTIAATILITQPLIAFGGGNTSVDMDTAKMVEVQKVLPQSSGEKKFHMAPPAIEKKKSP